MERVRTRLKNRRGVELIGNDGTKLLLIPKAVVHNKHSSKGFFVIASTGGFFEFQQREIADYNPFKLMQHGFHMKEAVIVLKLLFEVFEVPQSETISLLANGKN